MRQGVCVNHPDLHQPIIIPSQNLEDLNPDLILEAVDNVMQGEDNHSLSEEFEVEIVVSRIVRGAGRRWAHVTNTCTDLHHEKSLVTFQNDDKEAEQKALRAEIEAARVEYKVLCNPRPGSRTESIEKGS